MKTEGVVTYRELERKTGVHHTTFTHFAKGRRRMTVFVLAKLAKAFPAQREMLNVFI